MFGEAFAAELGTELAHSAASSVSGINMTALNPQWTVGGEEQDCKYEETDDNIIFSKYVFSAVKRSFLSLDVFHRDNRDLSEEDTDNLNFWVKFQKASTNQSKLKKYVRKHVPATVRPRLWQELSGGTNFMSKLPNLYQETCVKLFGKGNVLPENVSSCTLANDNYFMSYYLTSEGVTCLRRVLFVLSHFHPDITFCPILQQVAAIFLHFMEEVWCFACMTAMLSGRKLYFDQTHAQADATESAFHICSMTVLKKETKRLQHFVLSSADKTEVDLFPDWLRMLFQYLDFTVLMRLVDCFVVEGPKIFFRSGLFLVRLFYEYTLDFEKIGFPSPKDFVIALGQYSEALKIQADDFIKATLRMKIKNKQINSAIEKCLSEEKHQSMDTNEETKISRMISYDVKSISDIISPRQWECLIGWLPARIQLQKPEIAFTTDIDGFSLKTLYNKTEEEDQTLLILKTDKNEIFGGYLSMPLADRKKGKRDLTFFGTGETFMFCIEPLMERFVWTEIDQVDGKTHQLEKRKSSFVVVDIKSSSHRKRRSFRMSKRKVSVKLQGIPKNFSFADVSHAVPSYGGIRKNTSVVHLPQYTQKEDIESSSEQSSPVAQLRGISARPKNSSMSPSNPPSVFSDSSPQSVRTPTHATTNNTKSTHGNRVPYQHSKSENQASEYSTVGEDDIDDPNRVTHLPDDLFLVEKRIELDHEDGTKHTPEHAGHVKHAPNDLYIAGNNQCLIIGGGGGYGIWFDEGLYHGRSEVCNTFHNRILTKANDGDFKIIRLEVFRFRDIDL